MNIQFFGHSIFSSSYKHGKELDKPTTLVEYINEKYGIKGRYIPIPAISEERILMEIKKYKPHIDFAVISHPHPMNVYFPSWNRDFTSAVMPKENIRHWTKNPKESYVFSKGRFFSERTMNDEDFDRMTWDKVNEHLITFKEIHYNPDLQKNRYYGALIQIVEYLKNKNIKAIHLINEEYIPGWFNFTHGIVDIDILRYQEKPPYATSYAKSINAINDEGNKVAARQLVEYIEHYEKYAIEFKNNT